MCSTQISATTSFQLEICRKLDPGILLVYCGIPQHYTASYFNKVLGLSPANHLENDTYMTYVLCTRVDMHYSIM